MARTGMIERLRNAVGLGTKAAPSSPRAGFMRDNRHVALGSWRPPLREARQDVQSAYRDATARAIDLIQNVGWIAGAIDQSVANTVGNGLRLDALPDPKALGMSPALAKKWAQTVEKRWRVWAGNPYECDIEGRQSFGQMQAQAFRSYLATGEIVAEFPWRDRPGGTFKSKVRVLPPFRLSQKTLAMERLFQGVRRDADGMPVGYLFDVPQDEFAGKIEIERPARERLGRVLVAHVFDGMPGQVRGITPLVPALTVARQFDRLANATLAGAIIQTVFAATITSETPTEEVMQGLLTPQELGRMSAEGRSPFDAWAEAQAGWYDGVQVDVGLAGRLAHLFPGQKLEFLTPGHPANNYRDFAMHLLREIARAIGITYEEMTGDYAGVTFSSIRMATDVIFRIVSYRRAHIVAPFCQAAYANFLEEEIDVGRVPLPGGIAQFLAERTAIANAQWHGTPKPQADDVKAAKAHETWRTMGVISDAQIAAELGRDIEDVYAERAEEAKLRKRYKLPEPVAKGQVGAAINPGDESETADGSAD